ncbi:hypothetical protein B0H67DRAFT_646983 [Lasiosphaeris hirsuta]|uniref:Uncharacterized protein n=1 Tax=Lasiosphaeris hirsuta TaxID=260670 RepID=A0AA40A9K7_9PEZI|nr:hypothetical protein B0H67DRAFT_646983 [Lasiosphaeris hirsuta]
MDVSSPIKRRVLGALDPNASPKPSPHHQTNIKQQQQQQQANKSAYHVAPRISVPRTHISHTTPEPEVSEPEALKRPVSMAPSADDEPAAKRPRFGVDGDAGQEPRSPRSCTLSGGNTSNHSAPASPAASSVFDNSALDTSQATTVTEPDVNSTPVSFAAPPRVPRFSREEAREKAEIIRLRLGLANYKVRTGQTDVPLDQLQMRPIPRTDAGARSGRAVLPFAAEMSRPMVSSIPSGSGPMRRPLPGAPVRRPSPPSVGAQGEDEDDEQTEEEMDTTPDEPQQQGGEGQALPRLPQLYPRQPAADAGGGVGVDPRNAAGNGGRHQFRLQVDTTVKFRGQFGGGDGGDAEVKIKFDFKGDEEMKIEFRRGDEYE